MQILDFHRSLLSDQQGQEAFRKALFETIRGGEVVLDLGTGTGIHALFACQAGAARVYAVDKHNFISMAREIARANLYDDRISFIQASAGQLELPEKVDLIVAHHGLPGLFDLLPAARDRFLKEGGILIPARVDLFCSPLESAGAYEEAVGFWEARHHDLSFDPVRSFAVNNMHDRRINEGELLSEPARLASFDFYDIKEPRLSASVETAIARQGTLHGVGIWYLEWLTQETVLSTAPPCDLPHPLWLNEFLPVDNPLHVRRGDTVAMKVQTGAGGWGRLWRWEVVVRGRDGAEKARFAHSNFSHWLLTKDGLRKQSLNHAPSLTQTGAAARFILEACDGGKSVQWVEREVYDRFPNLFRGHADAASFVSEVVARYCE